MSARPDIPVYEVFSQKDALSFATHVGSVRAPSPEMALQLAREAYFRRESAFDIWVIPASSITHGRDFRHTLPSAPETKAYRMPQGYDNGPLWKKFKAHAQTIEDVAKEMSNGRSD